MPSLHPQQIPPAVRRPNMNVECAHFQLDGPHRVVSTAARAAGRCRPKRCTRSSARRAAGSSDRGRHPDLGPLPAGLNPGGVEPWGISNFQIFPNVEILIYGGWYLVYRYWPTSPGTHRFEATLAFHPARNVRERVEHEVAAVVFKEFALQDAGMLGGTQAALETSVIDEFPLNDQEILVRHFHAVVGEWVEQYRTRAAGGQRVTAMLPAGVRRPRAVRADVVPRDRRRALAATPPQHDGRAGSVLRRGLPAPRRRDRALRRRFRSTTCRPTSPTSCG